MKDLGDLMRKAQGLQTQMAAVQEKIAALDAVGAAGGGAVKVAINGKGYAKSVSIDKALLVPDDVDVLEDLITAAFNDAKAKMDTRQAEEIKALTAGLPLPPGLKLPF